MNRSQPLEPGVIEIEALNPRKKLRDQVSRYFDFTEVDSEATMGKWVAV